MKLAIDTSDRNFLDQLHRLGSGTIQELCDLVGVTATAVRQRLVRLQGHGLVARTMIRNGRGRPYFVYQVSESGLNQLGENYGDLALILWQEMQSIEEPILRERVVHKVREAMVKRYGQADRARPLIERLQQLQAKLSDRGFDVEVDCSGDLPILREKSCPYQELATTDSGICGLEQEIFGEVLGTQVVLTKCCLDGHHCCEFQAQPTSNNQTDESP
jgi:predicted ArsR family transcriptional regulator